MNPFLEAILMRGQVNPCRKANRQYKSKHK